MLVEEGGVAEHFILLIKQYLSTVQIRNHVNIDTKQKIVGQDSWIWIFKGGFQGWDFFNTFATDLF